jgi:hypothetical protein
MPGAFIRDFESGRREGAGQLVTDGVGYAHAGKGRCAAS